MSDRKDRPANAKKSNKHINNCGKCWQTFSDSDEYCRYCGTKRGEGEFNPADNIMECIYGPPPKEYAYTCKSCGHAWTQNMMLPSSVVACPKCGLRAIAFTASEAVLADDINERQSGTARGAGNFIPSRNVMECLYGPPPSRNRNSASFNIKPGKQNDYNVEQAASSDLENESVKKYNQMAAEQNTDGSFGVIGADNSSVIIVTASVITEFCENVHRISLFRQQLLNAIDYLMSMEAEIMKDKALINSVNNALELAGSRKILRGQNRVQKEFAAKIKSSLI